MARRDAPDDFSDFTVLVVKVPNLMQAESQIEKACRAAGCADAQRPSWYFTGVSDRRTANERYVAVSLKGSERLVASFSKLGELLQFMKVPPRNALTDEERKAVSKERDRLRREVLVLEKAEPPVPAAIQLVTAAVATLDNDLAAADKSRKTALINLRITEGKVH